MGQSDWAVRISTLDSQAWSKSSSDALQYRYKQNNPAVTPKDTRQKVTCAGQAEIDRSEIRYLYDTMGHLWEVGASRRGGLIALAIAGVSTLLALGITSLTVDPRGTPLFIFFLGAVLVSTLLAGWRSGLPTIIFSAVAGVWYYFRPLQDLD